MDPPSLFIRCEEGRRMEDFWTKWKVRMADAFAKHKAEMIISGVIGFLLRGLF